MALDQERLPLEISELIIDETQILGLGFNVLQNLSLVCKNFLHICRKHIFQYIDLRFNQHDSTAGESFKRFQRAVQTSPETGKYVRHLNLHFNSISTTDLPELADVLKVMTNVEAFGIYSFWTGYVGAIGWNTFCLPLREALVDAFLLPSLTHLTIHGIHCIPTDLIPHFLRVSTLDIACSGFSTSATSGIQAGEFRLPSRGIKKLVLGELGKCHVEPLITSITSQDSIEVISAKYYNFRLETKIFENIVRNQWNSITTLEFKSSFDIELLLPDCKIFTLPKLTTLLTSLDFRESQSVNLLIKLLNSAPESNALKKLQITTEYIAAMNRGRYEHSGLQDLDELLSRDKFKGIERIKVLIGPPGLDLSHYNWERLIIERSFRKNGWSGRAILRVEEDEG